jgi:hypothetical protein
VLDALGEERVRRSERTPEPAGAATSRALDVLPHPWHVFHGVDLGGERADHVAVGPAGVFTVESIRLQGAVIASTSGLWSHGRRRANNGVLIRALRQSRKLERLLDLGVRPILVVVASRLTGRVAWRIPVARPDEIAHLLTSTDSPGIGWDEARRAIDVLQTLTR